MFSNNDDEDKDDNEDKIKGEDEDPLKSELRLEKI